MIISNENRYIYIDSPKTGTTSIEQFLLENDKTATKNHVCIERIEYNFKCHSTAAQIKEILGGHYEKFRVFGFIRNPYSKYVSKYFFYKKGGKLGEQRNKKRIMKELKIQSTKLIPFQIWALFYPYTSNMEYFTDENDNIIVDQLGIFEDMNIELVRILDKLGLKMDGTKLRHQNKSNHEMYKNYYKSSLIYKLISKKVIKDLEFYNEILEKIYSKNSKYSIIV